MSGLKHTPGPWIATSYDSIEDAHDNGAFRWCDDWPEERGRPSEVWRGTTEGGATGLPGSVETTEANARLIAAAPDLLAALEYIVAWNPSDWSAEKARDLARAAIAKAKGAA
jgi:hypothetical protein